jgi:hypothetical protein
MTLTLGIDLGQARDRSVIVALDSRRVETTEAPEPRAGSHVRKPRAVTHHDVVLVKVLPIGMPYPSQVQAITATAEQLGEERGTDPGLFVDATGTGRSVLDLLRQTWSGPLTGVTITGGSNVEGSGLYNKVPKAILVAGLEIALSTRRLHCDPGLANADLLRRELGEFGYELSATTGQPKWEARTGHDDALIALSLSIYGAEHRGGSFLSFMRHEIAKRGDVPAGEQMSVAAIPGLAP